LIIRQWITDINTLAVIETEILIIFETIIIDIEITTERISKVRLHCSLDIRHEHWKVKHYKFKRNKRYSMKLNWIKLLYWTQIFHV